MSDARPLLSVDIGGSKVKILATGQTHLRKFPSGPELTPHQMIEGVRELAADWEYEAVSIGYPGLVGLDGPRSEPGNLGPGWVGFDFAAGFERPVRIVNDAAMQAMGSYDGGRMLFLSLGTGMGSTFIGEGVIVPLELGEIPHNGCPIGKIAGRPGMMRLGKKAWRKVIASVVPFLKRAFQADEVVLGGGNARYFRDFPVGARIVHNLATFRGGFRLWQLHDVYTLNGVARETADAPPYSAWRLV